MPNYAVSTNRWFLRFCIQLRKHCWGLLWINKCICNACCILLYKKEGNNGPDIVHRPAHNAVSRLAPRRSAPMHNIGAVMADALLKDTGVGFLSDSVYTLADALFPKEVWDHESMNSLPLPVFPGFPHRRLATAWIHWNWRFFLLDPCDGKTSLFPRVLKSPEIQVFVFRT